MLPPSKHQPNQIQDVLRVLDKAVDLVGPTLNLLNSEPQTKTECKTDPRVLYFRPAYFQCASMHVLAGNWLSPEAFEQPGFGFAGCSLAPLRRSIPSWTNNYDRDLERMVRQALSSRR